MQPQEFHLPFLKKEHVAHDAYEFYFDRSNASVSFLPGQYIRMSLPIEHPDERGTTRLFSITSSPKNTKELHITTRIIQSTFKKTLYGLPLQTSVKFFGPFGRFVLDETDTTQRIFLAGGIGITPYLSMLRYLRDTKSSLPVTLFASFQKPEDIVLQNELESIAQTLPTVKVVYTITRPTESQIPWKGEVGHVSKDMIAKYVPNWHEAIYYISGPPAMVDSIEQMVITMEVPTEQIKKEQFTGY